jgi:hypothetical protein
MTELDDKAEKIRALMGMAGKRTPPLFDRDGVMRCQICRKAFSDGEAVFQQRTGDGIRVVCEQCPWPGHHWVSLPCDNCRRPVYRIRRPSTPKHPWHGSIFKACSPRCRKVIHTRLAALRRREARESIICKVCGVVFIPKRKDAITCTGKCRAKLHRQRHRNG